MTRYISLLRGINVGGKRKILMTDLTSLYKKLGYLNVTSYIQSGNVIFDSKESEDQNVICNKIENAIYETFGFEVPVIIRNTDEFKELYNNNPFSKKSGFEIKQLCLTLLSDIPNSKSIDLLLKNNTGNDKFKIIKNNIYIYYPGKVRESKLTNNYFERKLKISATTRNWKSITKLFEISIN